MNQCVCSQLLPAALSLIGGAFPLQPDILRPAVSFITSCIANNGKPYIITVIIAGNFCKKNFFIRKFFVLWLYGKYGDLTALVKFLYQMLFSGSWALRIFGYIMVLIITSNYRDDPGSTEDDWRTAHTGHCSEGAVSIGANQQPNEQGSTHWSSRAYCTSTLSCYIHAWYVYWLIAL